MKDNFYWVDFAMGFSFPLIVIILWRLKKIDGFVWRLFWVGVLLGTCWELPLSILNEYSDTHAVARFLTPMPTPFPVIVIAHSFWDGGLFLAGVWLVYKILKPPYFEYFKWRELAILLLWGQVSELTVELTSTYNDAWEFIPRWWNPSLFTFNGHNITLLPQLVWLAAPVFFYAVALKIKDWKPADKKAPLKTGGIVP